MAIKVSALLQHNTDLVFDTSPKLGGALDTNNFPIQNNGNSVVITGNSYPVDTGTSGQVLTTNGAGILSWEDTELVTTFSAGTTGFTPSSATSGAITLAGTLSTTNGGTGLTTIGTTNQFLSVDATATVLEYKTISAGTGISVTPGTNVLTIANTGVTSIALALPVSVFNITGSPVTTTGTLTGSFTSQSTNTIFAAPDNSSGAPTFRPLVYDDLPLQLYVENPSTPITPITIGTNTVALGSGATATANGSFAQGAGTDARVFGQKAFANGAFATAGDAQHSVYVARNITTDDTPTELFLDGSAIQLVIPNNSVFTFDVLIAARRTDATGGAASYRFVGAVLKDTTSDSVTFIGTPSKTIVAETNTDWDATIDIDTVTGAFIVNAIGENAKTIRWVATIQTTEVTD